jgi:hypothetical protein
MAKKMAPLALEKMGLHPFDQAVLAAVLVPSGQLRSDLWAEARISRGRFARSPIESTIWSLFLESLQLMSARISNWREE